MRIINKVQSALIAGSILVLNACGGGGSTEQQTLTPTPTPSGSMVELSGTLSYDFVPLNAFAVLDYDDMVPESIKGVVVDLLNSAGSVVASTISDANGHYRFEVDANTLYRVRVNAHLQKQSAPGWQVKVSDNTQGNAQYAMLGSLVSSGTTDSIRNLHAASGWTGTSYSQERVAGPFAMLDSVYQLLEQLREAGLAEDLPATELRWSVNNRAVDGELSDGNIGTSFFSPSRGVMYILGDASSDTDEYDRSIIQHEFTHYLEDAISRSDSPGGVHTAALSLDMRLAFSEGLANAITGIATGSGIYQDSRTGARGTRVDIEDATLRSELRGWFNESSVGSIIQDLADDAEETGDELDLGLAAVLSALTSERHKNSSAMISIFTFLDALKSVTASEFHSAIDALTAQHNIRGRGALGEGESNDGGFSYALPVYSQLSPGLGVNVCSGGYSASDSFASLAPYFVQIQRFVILDIPSDGSYDIAIEKSAIGTGNKNPQAQLFSEGRRLVRGNGQKLFQSDAVDTEQETLFLEAGTYVLGVYEESNLAPNGATACFDVSLNES